MSYLLAISIGPVQEFIAAARRTADLYAGSQLLLEVTRQIALTLEDSGATLIFPSDPQHSGANKVLAVVTGDPRALVEAVKAAARAYLTRQWDNALGNFSARAAVDATRATAQVEGFLEIYAAWIVLDKDNYSACRLRVEQLLAGRKALRDFQQAAQDDAGIPKSSLDASRASVIGDPQALAMARANHKSLRINATEHLDAISLLKRIYGSSMKAVIDTRTMARRAHDMQAMPSDRDFEDEDSIIERQPYYAILHADGDKIGALIETKDSAEEHQGFSTKLSEFSNSVEKLVNRHHGFKIYSGGDDVLALLPVTTAVACARELAAEFAAKLPAATLSVGMAIVHYREPLSISLEYARAAEKAAKNKSDPDQTHHGNRLAVALHTRGGAPMTVVEQWKPKGQTLELEKLLELYQTQSVSRGVPYELKRLAQEWLGTGLAPEVLQAEANRIVTRKEGAKLQIPALDSIKALEDFADKLVLARFLSGLEGQP